MQAGKLSQAVRERRRHAKFLRANATAAMFAAIEIHNKPLFQYRYEVCTLLMVNAWELALKSYIAKKLKSVRLVRRDKTTKPFTECVGCVASHLGKDFEATKQNLEILYEYRNKVAHLYATELEAVVLGLLKSTVLFFSAFMEKHLKVKLHEADNLILLPIGFRKPTSPLDFLSNQSAVKNSSVEVKAFLASIKKSSEHLQKQGVDESVIINYSMAIFSESRIKNADLTAAINNATTQENVISVQNVITPASLTNDPSAKQVRVLEDSIFETVFNLTYFDVVHAAKTRFSDFSQNRHFNDLMRELKKNPNFARTRLLNLRNTQGTSQTFYSRAVIEELTKHYNAK